LYECVTWSLELKLEHRLKAVENRVLRRIFGVKRGEVGENFSSSIISRMIMSMRIRARHVACMGEKKNVYRFW
jgi:hypothetical protein